MPKKKPELKRVAQAKQGLKTNGDEIARVISTMTENEKHVLGKMLSITSSNIKTVGDLELFAKGLQKDSQIVKNILAFDCLASNFSPIVKYLFLNIETRDKLVTLIDSGAIEEQTQDQVRNLAKRAKSGDLVALHELAKWAHEATLQIEQLAEMDPAYVALVAEGKSTWPILAVLNKSKILHKMDLLEKIALGSSAPEATSYTRALMTPTPPQEWAVRLLKTIDVARMLKYAFYSKPSTDKNFISVQPRYTNFYGSHVVITVTEDLLINKEVLHDFAKSMDSLPEFSINCVSQWWEVARKLFLCVTNNTPWQIKKLSSYANSQRIDKKDKKHKQDGKMRDNVVKAVRKAFFDLAKS